MRENTCCFTGHRVLPVSKEWLESKLKEAVEALIKRGYTRFCCGGALGFDTAAAIAVLRLKAVYPQIRLALFLPCPNQASRWSPESIRLYEAIKARADEVTTVCESYTRDCMFRRNRRLVDESSVCVCFLSSDHGGTAYTVNYARKKGLEIINLYT